MTIHITMRLRNQASDMIFSVSYKSRFSPVNAACVLLCTALGGLANAQTPSASFQPAIPGVLNSQQTSAASVLRGAVGGVDFSVNANVAKLTVEVEKDDLPADGQPTQRSAKQHTSGINGRKPGFV